MLFLQEVCAWRENKKCDSLHSMVEVVEMKWNVNLRLSVYKSRAYWFYWFYVLIYWLLQPPSIAIMLWKSYKFGHLQVWEYSESDGAS